HILKCGDLSMEFGSIILLEDDLLVSPWFYWYAKKALKEYKDASEIAGISLYSHRVMESNSFYPFEPMCGPFSVYFIQYAVSWGQAWTAAQWQAFREWSAVTVEQPNGIATYLERWSADSWKKDFVRYMIANDKYFACPASSYSTNFGDQGAHFTEPTSLYQVPLKMDHEQRIFRKFRREEACYDACFEPVAEWVKKLVKELKGYDLEVDLLGLKDAETLEAEYVLTSAPVRKKIKSWGMRMRPLIQNLVFEIPGDDIFLARRDDLLPMGEKDRLNQYIRLHRFFYPIPKLRSQLIHEILRGMRIIK
ncbi:MAG: hypothetical protein AAF570_28525, partial [Bacteroidota bacterium]